VGHLTRDENVKILQIVKCGTVVVLEFVDDKIYGSSPGCAFLCDLLILICMKCILNYINFNNSF
jgi:hypothetical protein